MTYAAIIFEKFFTERPPGKDIGPLTQDRANNKWMWEHHILGPIMKLGEQSHHFLSTEQANLLILAEHNPEFVQWMFDRHY